MSKPQYTPGIEDQIWNHIQTNQDETFEAMSEKLGLTAKQLTSLSIAMYAGSRDKFNKDLHTMLEGVPE